MSWTSFKLSKLPDVATFPIWGHSSTLSNERDIIIFGGYDYYQEKPVNTTFLLNTSQSNGLTKPHLSGSTPPPIYGHTATQMGRKMFVFGGNQQDNSQINDMYQLNTTNLSWSKPKAFGEAPTPRHGHTTVPILDSYLLVFGGCGRSKNSNEIRALNDIHLFNIDRNAWISLPQWMSQGNVMMLGDGSMSTPPLTPGQTGPVSPLSRGRSSTVSSDLGKESSARAHEMLDMLRSGGGGKGCSPSPRFYHTCNVVAGRHLVVFGGFDGTHLLNDLYILSLDSMDWFQPQTSGETPSPRCGHSSITIGNKLYIFGGSIQDPLTNPHCDNELYVFDFDALHWSHIKPSGIMPSPRTGQISLSVASRLFIIGGSEGILNCKSKLPNSYYVLETLKVSTPTPAPHPVGPSASTHGITLRSQTSNPILTVKSPPRTSDKDGADDRHGAKSPEPLFQASAQPWNSNTCHMKYNILKSQNEELGLKLRAETEKRKRLEREIELLRGTSSPNPIGAPTLSGKQNLQELFDEIYELWNCYERRQRWKEMIEKNSQHYLEIIKMRMEVFANLTGVEFPSMGGYDDLKSASSSCNGDYPIYDHSEAGSYLHRTTSLASSFKSQGHPPQSHHNCGECELDELVEDHLSVGSLNSTSSNSCLSTTQLTVSTSAAGVPSSAANTPLSPKKPNISHSRSISNPIPALSKLKEKRDKEKDQSPSPPTSLSVSAEGKSQKLFGLFGKKNRASGTFAKPSLEEIDETSSVHSSSSMGGRTEPLAEHPLTSSAENEQEDSGVSTEEIERSKARKKLGKALKIMILNREKERDKVSSSSKDLSMYINQMQDGKASSTLTPGKTNEKDKRSKSLKLFGTGRKDSGLKVEVIERVIGHIETHGVEVEGIFRQSGNGDTVKGIVKSIQHGEPNLSAEIHNVTNALKQYIKGLDPPLIPYEFFVPLLDARRNEDIETIRNIFWRIPSDNRSILTQLVSLLVKISEKSDINKMTPSNLAIVLGPSILKPRTPTVDRMALVSETQLQCDIMQVFVEDFRYIFNEPPIGSPKSFTDFESKTSTTTTTTSSTASITAEPSQELNPLTKQSQPSHPGQPQLANREIDIISTPPLHSLNN